MSSRASRAINNAPKLPGGRAVEYIVAVPARRYTQMTKVIGTLHPQLVQASRTTGQEALTEAELEHGRRLVVAHDPETATQGKPQAFRAYNYPALAPDHVQAETHRPYTLRL